MEKKKSGYCTNTYKLRLYRKHMNWIKETKSLYNRVMEFYYHVLSENLELMEFSNYNLLRELEVLSVGTREMKREKKEAKYSLKDFPTIPLYFRRAAINSAISMMRGYLTSKKNQENHKEKGELSMARTFEASPVFYKGMYKNFTDDAIQLKLFTGKEWKWVHYRFQGREIPEGVSCLSPTLSIDKKQAYLHVPIVKQVDDIRTIQERMKEEKKILALAFPGNDCLATGAVLKRDGIYLSSIFFNGGAEMKAKRRIFQNRIREQKKKEGFETNRKDQIKIENINAYYAHLISRRIVEYCKQEQISIIVVPNYEQGIDFAKKGYMKTDNFEWIGRRIIRYLKYKAFAEGILVSTIRPYHISDVCSECGAKIKRYNEGHAPGNNYYGGKLFLCPNGHRGNSGLNTAKNVGRKFLSYYS